MNCPELEVFLAAAETLSFSEAAKHLHLSQPTVSHNIQVLEHELGVTLFDRSSSGLRLTDAGRLLLPRARKLVRDSVEIRELISSVQETIAGRLRIVCSTISGKYLVPQLAARFHLRYPAVSVKILSCSQATVIPQLLDDEAGLDVSGLANPNRLDQRLSQQGGKSAVMLAPAPSLLSPAGRQAMTMAFSQDPGE